MKLTKLQTAFGEIADDLIISAERMPNELGDNKLNTNKKRKVKLRWVAVTASMAAVLLFVLAIPLIGMLNKPTTNIVANVPPKVAFVSNGGEITGIQSSNIGELKKDADKDIIQTGFYIGTVVEAKILCVLPDTYRLPTVEKFDSVKKEYRVAELQVINEVRGKNLPNKIYLRYENYNDNIFEGFESFIISLNQIGIENYNLINATQNRLDYFDNMFTVFGNLDLGYGSVIAFNNGKTDCSFWDKANNYVTSSDMKNYFEMSKNYYPANLNSNIEEVKVNILALAEDDENTIFTNNLGYDYLTENDFSKSNEAEIALNQIKAQEGTFSHNIENYWISKSTGETHKSAVYVRLINGFETKERISIYTNDTATEVNYSEEKFTSEDLGKIPNIGEAIQKIELNESKPSHSDLAKNTINYTKIGGWYRKVDEKIYGIVKIVWQLRNNEEDTQYIFDDCYYIYDDTCLGKIVERNELFNIIGKDNQIESFNYGNYVEAIN